MTGFRVENFRTRRTLAASRRACLLGICLGLAALTSSCLTVRTTVDLAKTSGGDVCRDDRPTGGPGIKCSICTLNKCNTNPAGCCKCPP